MMLFRVLKKNLTTILGRAAGGRFKVFGYQQQSISADEVSGDNRRVQVFYGAGEFSKGKASLNGPVQHEIDFRVELTVSAAAKGNLAVINNPVSTEQQIQAALASVYTAASRADESMDELIEIVYQILMDGRNIDIGMIGLPVAVSDRWVSSIAKGDTVPQGEYVILTANIGFKCQAKEEVPGDIGQEVSQAYFENVVDLDGDNNEKTGVIVGN
jgi:hypothetical protein